MTGNIVVGRGGGVRLSPSVAVSPSFDAAAWLAVNCKAYWGMETSGSGDPIVDATGRGNDLSAFSGNEGDMPQVDSGKVNNAVLLSAANQNYLSRPSTSDLQIGSGDFVIAVWVNPNDLSDTRPVVSKGATESVGFELAITDDGTAHFMTIDSGDAAQTDSNAVVTHSWSLLIARYDATTKKLSIRVNNGGLVEVVRLTDYTTETSDFLVGANFASATFFDGLIDETLIAKSDTPLTSDEFDALCNFLWNSGNGRALTFP